MSTNPSHRWLPVHAIARVTFREILRDRLLYNVGIFAVLLLGLSLFAGRIVISHQERMIIDFGILGLGLSLGFASVLFGASMLAREYERRTIHLALSRPISRSQFLAGKFLGLAGVLALNAVLFTGVLLLVGLATGAVWSGALVGGVLLQAVFLQWLQALVLGAIAVFFSSFSTTTLAVVLTMGIFIVGANASELRWLAIQGERDGTGWLFNGLAAILPNFENFQIGVQLSYGVPIPAVSVVLALGYASALCVAALAGAALSLRSLDNG